ncbi:MAG: tRNA-intron lyase [Desulfurococcales archaeon ex4484_217_1]|nr:MAG: tRNA-intron lyase [Desulfurococcales archaeon ex4484_217_1]
MCREVAKGHLVGIKVIVWNCDEASKLYSLGFYGKPLGLRKPKKAEFKTPLVLSIIEALYLCEKGILKVYKDSELISFKNLLDVCCTFIPRCIMLYNVYKDLREKGYIVRSGLKFGSDFAVYEKGPGIDHAPYLIHVLSVNEKINPVELVRAGRLSHSVRKKFIIATTSSELGSKVEKIMFKWYRP